MSQLAIYLDEKTARLLAKAARRDRLSRSAWVKKAVEAQLANRLPESFFQVLGTWDDGRSPEEILADIRRGAEDKAREPIA
jgi:hypothetical protein